MIKDKAIINDLIETTACATGLGIMFFDSNLRLVSYSQPKKIVNEFYCLGMSQISKFITDQIGHFTVSRAYTYFLDENIVCNVVLLFQRNVFDGAVVSQLMLIKQPAQKDINNILIRFNETLQMNELKKLLQNIPIVACDKIVANACILLRVSLTLYEQLPDIQVVSKKNKDYRLTSKKIPPLYLGCSRKSISQETYIKLVDCIKKGDVEVLHDILSNIIATVLTLDKYKNRDIIDSIRIRFMKVCGLGAYAAVQANVPFQKVNEIFDEAINKIITLDCPSEIIELMKSVLIEYTNMAAKAKNIAHSTAIRRSLEYINLHYSEKITLELLAKNSGLNKCYLSTLIKKETGSNLLDIINRIRVERSKTLLNGTQNSINDIAKSVGFSYSNHFASVFKNLTGYSPIEYRGVSTMDFSQNVLETKQNNIIQLLRHQLHNRLSLINSLYNIALIVDPLSRMAWPINDEPFPESMKSCQDLCNQSKECELCIAKLAYVQNKELFKLEKVDNELYLTWVAPKMVGEKTYIIEVVRKVTNDFYFTPPSLIEHEETQLHKSIICNQKHISEQLSICIRESRLTNYRLSIIVSRMCNLNQVNDSKLYCDIRREYCEIIKKTLPHKEYWIAQITGDIVLLVLKRVEASEVLCISNIIKTEMEKMVFDNGNSEFKVLINNGMQELTDSIENPDKLLDQAFIDMHSKNLAEI